MQGDGLAIITEMLPYPTASQDPSRHSFWISNLIIQCIDSFGSKPGNGTLSTPEVARRIAAAKEHDVQVTGALWSPLHVGGCWQFGGEKRGVSGRFQGPFDAPLNAPILVVGNIVSYFLVYSINGRPTLSRLFTTLNSSTRCTTTRR